MKPLSHLQSLAFTLGGLLLLAGALLPMVPTLSHYGPYVFSAGALLFGTLQLVQRYVACAVNRCSVPSFS